VGLWEFGNGGIVLQAHSRIPVFPHFPIPMLLSTLVAVSTRVAQTSGRREKIRLLAELLQSTPPAEIEIVVSYLSGSLRQGRIGLGWNVVQDSAAPAAEQASLELSEVDMAFERLGLVKGKGSTAEKGRLLHVLFSRASQDEQRFLVALISGELRQGALEGLLMEAVARAFAVSVELVRRAAMTTGDLPLVARAAAEGGSAAQSQYSIQLFRPLLPMLADTASDPADALVQLGEAALEYKIDGARVQVHKSGDEVRVYSRRLNDVTAAVPELVELVRQLPAREIILDGETIALRENGSPHPFQVTMRRYGRKLDVDTLRAELPLASFFFDVLWVDGAPLLDEPYARRIGALRSVLSAPSVIPSLVTSSSEEADRFLQSALAQGHEGIMAKALDAPYEAGHRGARWLKVKPAHTLDLVVLAAEWGHGRRHGWLSNLHLGARDSVNGGFVMLGKTFKGLTDAMLEWQTRRFLELEIGRDAYTVHIRPEVVVEVAFNDVQVSSQYPGKLALRFARVKRYREDKTAAQADTIQMVQEIFRKNTGG
jgi:DNA ligase-1